MLHIFLPFFIVSQYKNQVQRECCLEAMKETPVSYTCEIRAEYITDDDGPSCVTAFLHCCKEMETQRSEKKEENLMLARSKRRGHGMGWTPEGLFMVIL